MLGDGWLGKMKTGGSTGMYVPTHEDLQTSLYQTAVRGAEKFLRDGPTLMLGLEFKKTMSMEKQ